MKYTVNTNEQGYILSIAHTYNDTVELDLDSMELDYLQAYKLVDGEVELDLDKKAEIIAQRGEQEKQKRIAVLKQYLSDTDYIWNSIREGGRTEEYYAEVIERRKAVRKEIQELEG